MRPLYFFLLFSSVLILSSGSCRKGGQCEESLDLSISTLTINFKDSQSNKYLYEELNPLFSKDSLKILDSYGNQLMLSKAPNQIPSSVFIYYVIGFAPIYDERYDSQSFNSEVCKNYIVKYAYNETDTLSVCFKAKNTKCGSVFETIKVFHKGTLIGKKDNDIGLVITVFKN